MSKIPKTGKIVVYDTEFTSWEGFVEKDFKDLERYPEIIQIGAAVLDVSDNFRELDSFSIFVKPKLNPILSQYIIELTKIQQSDINQYGVCFADALHAFQAFIPTDTLALVCHGRDGQFLEINMDLNEVTLATKLPPEIDFNKLLLSEGIISRPSFSSALPELFELNFVGNAHNALDDARALACVIRHLRARNQI